MRIKKNITILAIGIINFILVLVAMKSLSNFAPINIFATELKDKMVSKQMLLVIPAIIVLISILQVIYRMKTMDKKVTTWRIVEDALFACIDGCLIAVNWLLVYVAYLYTKSSIVESGIVPIGNVLAIMFGIALAAIYSTFPINKTGSIFGLRTKDTLADNKVWRIANRFNGFTGFVSALIIVLLSVYFILFEFNLIYMLIAAVVCIVLMFVVPPIYAKIITKKLNNRVVE